MFKVINVPEIFGIIAHCETVLHNHDCPYLNHGCTGCRMVPYPIKMRITDTQKETFMRIFRLVENSKKEGEHHV